MPQCVAGHHEIGYVHIRRKILQIFHITIRLSYQFLAFFSFIRIWYFRFSLNEIFPRFAGTFRFHYFSLRFWNFFGSP